MHTESNKLIYDTTECSTCTGTGKYTPFESCPRQNKPQRGVPCPYCGGTRIDGHHQIPKPQVECPKCEGSLVEPETRYDAMPIGILDYIPLKVIHSNRAITFNESWIGTGCLWSTMDYGAHKALSDEKLIAKVREGIHFTQACKVVDKQDMLPAFIAILTNDSGYSVRSGWMIDQVLVERGASEGMAYGIKVYSEGGNGTIAGLFKDKGR